MIKLVLYLKYNFILAVLNNTRVQKVKSKKKKNEH